MRSTGEVMGFDDSFGMAFAKAQLSAGNALPSSPGTIVVTVNDPDKETVTPILRRFLDLGFEIMATRGTHAHLARLGIPSARVFKSGEGRPDIVDHIVSGDIALLINTPLGKRSQYDDYAMRRAAITYGTPYLTTMSATGAACDALIALRSRAPGGCGPRGDGCAGLIDGCRPARRFSFIPLRPSTTRGGITRSTRDA
jgi:carbamoyl-phosphate synthase large subunit